MAEQRWPRTPSETFERWVEQRDAYRERNAPRGYRFVDGDREQYDLYISLGGLAEAFTLEDLVALQSAWQRIKDFQAAVWDAEVLQVVEAAKEGGLYETSMEVGCMKDWISRAWKQVQPLDPKAEVASWIKTAVAGTPKNPLIRSEELKALWRTVTGARQIAEGMRNLLLWELHEAGESHIDLARAVGWRRGRLDRHIDELRWIDIDRRARVRQNQVPGVIPLQRATKPA